MLRFIFHRPYDIRRRYELHRIRPMGVLQHRCAHALRPHDGSGDNRERKEIRNHGKHLPNIKPSLPVEDERPALPELFDLPTLK